MSDERKDEQHFTITVRDGEILAELRDGVFVSVRWSSPKEAQVMLWQGDKLIAPDVGNLNRKTYRDRLIKDALERFGATEAPHVAEDLGDLAAYLRQPGPSGKTLYDELAEVAERSAAVRMVTYACKNAELFHNSEMVGFAEVKAGEHTENYKIRSRQFRLWVRHIFYQTEKELAEERQAEAQGALQEGTADTTPETPREQSLADAISQLETLALFEGLEEEVHIRVAEADGRIYLDLCDPDWRVVEISREGWRVISGHEAPVKFIRKSGMLPLPEPVAGGSLEPLRKLIHLGNGSDGERNWRLLAAWLVHSLTPDGPYTVLALLGNQGSGKSTTQRILKSLIDPNVSPLRRKPKEDRDLYVAATNGWVISLNNMSGVPEWLSDALCTLAEGGGLSVRKLYTDDEETLLDAMRPIAINGIGDVLTRPDLLDRAVIVRLPDFDKGSSEDTPTRMSEDEIYAKVDEERPGILGALLDAVTTYLSNKDGVPRREISNDLRMVDFAVCGTATETALMGEEGSFLKAYRESRSEARDTALEAWPIALPVWELAKGYSKEGPWEGTASDLLGKLNDRVDDDDLKHGKDWPKQPNHLTGQLNRLAPDLAGVGVYVKTGLRGSSGERLVRLYYSPEE